MQEDTSEQEAVLRRFRRGSEPMEVVRALYELTQKDTPLLPGWSDLWERVKASPEVAAVPATILKSISDAVDSISHLDTEILSIRLRPAENVTLLLGAGASAPSGIPTVTGLLPELWLRAAKMGRDDIDSLARWCNSQRITNIEDLLTAAYVADFAAKNPAITGLLNYFLFGSARPGSADVLGRGARGSTRTPAAEAASIALLQDTLQTLFGLLAGIMIPAKPNASHRAIVQFAKERPNTSIVTTNYDGCIDEALIEAAVPINTYLDEQDPQPGAVDLIKMHGSINWTYCDSCHAVRQFDLLRLKQSFEDDTATYAVIGICRACGGQRRPLLVPPMAFKFIIFPNLIRLWNAARERIEQSDYLVVVGHSFSEADAYISKIISRSLTVNAHQRMIVCDPAAHIVPMLRERFSAHIDRFDPMRILRAGGSCDEVLPDVLASLTSAHPPSPNGTGATPSDGPQREEATASAD